MASFISGSRCTLVKRDVGLKLHASVRLVQNAVECSSRWHQSQGFARESLMGQVQTRAYANDAHSMEDLLQSLRATNSDRGSPGEVFLVGTGPGDPGLLTMRAVRTMQMADVVLYDRLISPEILDLVSKEAIMVYVGKNRGFHTRTQTEIHELLCRFAGEGARVVRLKGGDPFVFGRGGEEMEYLRDRGIIVHTIPGITAASGISAELGIPLTHRGLATGCAFITGHAREGGEDMLDDSMLTAADQHTTLVVYMGLNTLPSLMERLSSAGLPGDTPCAAIERGTTPQQRGVYAQLSELTMEVGTHELVSPTLVFIGKVVSLSPGWRMAQNSGCSLQDGRFDHSLSRQDNTLGLEQNYLASYRS